MGLLNDVRFYLMVALAVLFLIVVGMCSTAYQSGPDGHASSGVSHGSEGDAKMDEQAHADATETSETEPAEGAEMAEESTTEETTEDATGDAMAESEGSSTAQAVVATTTAAAATTASVANAEETEAAEAETAGTETEETAATMETAEATTTMVEVKGFELSELADTGAKVPDLNTDIGNLKSDMARYSGRIDEATSMFDKVKSIIAK